jgi:3',5'-cyclic AMP phosphodiesterase CpdA
MLTMGCALFAQTPYTQIVLLGDPHLPGKNILAKGKVIQTLNDWKDVNMVVALGDLCSELGTPEEYTFAHTFFSMLNKPFYPINGNHDYFYANERSENGKKQRASFALQKEKLQTFRKTFSLENNYFTLERGGYLLIFLSVDGSKYLTEISTEQLAWLEKTLKENPTKPTIAFFHAPLNNTLLNTKKNYNQLNYIAQPSTKINAILQQNPQLFLWVSGHTHTSFEEESFASPINLYDNHVNTIHNSDMNKKSITTNSLFLYPTYVIIKTYNHTRHSWEDKLERQITVQIFR